MNALCPCSLWRCVRNLKHKKINEQFTNKNIEKIYQPVICMHCARAVYEDTQIYMRNKCTLDPPKKNEKFSSMIRQFFFVSKQRNIKLLKKKKIKKKKKKNGRAPV
eukprot:TRINITY_DN24064_c0_g1_i1.p4 TRINITY_DN24064_c0_g1~~TRINITY_DN24064_c0_g1_i1.p4  ORF type:complete len:106 (+),score=7.90 TRINITY_DN24064_c0_g1_i1:544-861(+)